MGKKCEDCRKWEEVTYWTRFRCLHFITVLQRGSLLQHRIPYKFVKNLKEKLADIISLKGPSGCTWSVGLVRSGDDLFLQNGWQKFVKDHFLEEKDILVFRYNGVSCFDVLMFDQSFCEKESSYFVKNCCRCKVKGRIRESSIEVMHVGNAYNHTSSSKKKQRRNDLEMPHQSPRCNFSKRNAKLQKERTRVIEDVCRKRKFTRDAPSIKRVKPKIEKDGEELYIDLNPSYPLHFVSKRRPVSEEEKNRAFELACADAATRGKPHFIVVMQPTHVSMRFLMAIPADSVRSYLPPRKQDVTLRLKENIWTAKYMYKVHGSSAITGNGWADFVLENNIEVGDVCLFEPVRARVQNTMLLDVHIFRVVDKVVPLTKVTIPFSERGKKSKYYDTRRRRARA